jgi:cytoskeleton protein RodZ
MSEKAEADAAEPEFVNEHIGEKLRGAREAKSMSVDEIARRLNLEAHVVDGLEQNSYQNLPEPAYVRGYLLAYIRLMELPESLLKSFDEANPVNAPLLTANRPTRTACSDDGWVKCVSGGLVVILVIVVGLWAMEQSFNILDFQRLGLSPQQSDPAMVEQSEEVDETLVPGEEATDSFAAAADFSPEQAATSEQVIQGDTIQTPAEEMVAVAVDGSSATEQANIAEEQPPATLPVLTMKFSDDTWIRIDDEEGNRLEAGTFRKGDDIYIEHEGALHLIIGRTQNVEVGYAGQPVDLSTYQTGKVARLVLGEPVE